MPIRINLLAEAIAEEDLRRRDPVKRAIYGGAFVVALSLVWFSSTWLEGMVDRQKLTQIEGEIQTHTNDYAQAQSSLKKIGDMQNRMEALDHLTRARFLQGDLMNALQTTYVPNVQLTRLRVDQSYTEEAAVGAKTTKKGKTPAKPAAVIEHITVTLDAKDFSSNPGDQVNHYKDALLKQPFFSSAIDPTNGIRLTNLSPLQTPMDGKPFVMFSLECHFTDRTP